MQKTIIATSLLLSSLAVSAQTEKQSTLDAQSINAPEATTVPITELANISEETCRAVTEEASYAMDSIRIMPHLPYYMTRPYIFSTWMPTSPLMWGMPLDLHEGLNAQIGFGVMVGFGDYNPFKGASFFSDVSLVYAKQLSKHWSFALGGTLSRFKFFNDNVFAGDLFAIGNYKFNDHWSASLYASYYHMPDGMNMYNFSMLNDQCARIGGEVTYKFNEKFAVSVGVSTEIPTGTEQRPWKPMHSIEDGRR